GQISSTSILLGLWHMVRSPVHYSRLILLLILATSLGMFAAGFRATLDRSYNDRARYQAGAPLRVDGIREPTTLSPADLTNKIRGTVGASTASPALRTNVSYTPKQFTNVDSALLAIDPASFSSVAYWRNDFSSRSLTSIERSLAKDAPKDPAGLLLPDGARWLGVWVKTPSPNPNYALSARLIDRNGRVLDYDLTGPRGPQVALGDWTFFTTSLLQPGFTGSFRGRSTPAPAQPLHFVSLYVRSRNSPQPETITDYFDDLQASTAAANQVGPAGFVDETLLLDFEQVDRLEPIDGLTTKPTTDTFSRSEKEAHSGSASGQLIWSRDRTGETTHGFRVHGDGQAVDVYASDSFLRAAGLHTGQTAPMFIKGVYASVHVAGSFSFFPTYTPDTGGHLLVADLDRLLYEVNRTPGATEALYANEVWAGGDVGAAPAAALKQAGVAADNYVSLSDILATQQRDPLVAASWEGILFLAFAAALLLTALGFVVYSYLTASARSLEFAVLRTMGLSTLQIIGVVSFEQLFVVLSGVLTGTILGLPLSRLMIGYMGITETGATVVPPFVSSVSWQAVVTSYLGIAVVLIAAVASLVFLYSRLSVSRVLRIGEA
ncbi:MAG: ABC transporter permease, partial [Dehalococcoidia bacterium]